MSVTCPTLARQPVTRALSHLFKMKKTDTTKRCCGDTEHVSHTPLISLETCTPSFTVRGHLPKVTIPPTDRAFLLQGIGSCTAGHPSTAEWTSVSWYNSYNGTMHGTETDAPPHTTWITSTNRTPRKSHKGQAQSSKPGQLIWSDRVRTTIPLAADVCN